MQRTFGVILAATLLLGGCAPFDDAGTAYRHPTATPGLTDVPPPRPYPTTNRWVPPPPPPPYPYAGSADAPMNSGPWTEGDPDTARPTGHPIELFPRPPDQAP